MRNIIDLVWANRGSSWLAGTPAGGGDPVTTVNPITTDDPFTTNDPFTAAVRKSFREAIEWIENDLGRNPGRWAWGDVHKLTAEHRMGSVKLLARIFNMNRGPFSPGGSFHTVCPYSYDFTEPFVVNHGASQRHIYSVADWDDSFSVIPTGTSGIPASKYYCDQTELYVNDQYRPDLFSREAVENAARYSMKLLPESK